MEEHSSKSSRPIGQVVKQLEVVEQLQSSFHSFKPKSEQFHDDSLFLFRRFAFSFLSFFLPRVSDDEWRFLQDIENDHEKAETAHADTDPVEDALGVDHRDLVREGRLVQSLLVTIIPVLRVSVGTDDNYVQQNRADEGKVLPEIDILRKNRNDLVLAEIEVQSFKISSKY